MSYLIPLTILLPLVAGLAIFALGLGGKLMAKLGVLAALASFLLSVVIVYEAFGKTQIADGSIATVVPAIEYAPGWLKFKLPVALGSKQIKWQLALGVDGIGSLMVLLTGIVGLAVSVFSLRQIENRTHHYVGLLLITQSMLFGVFMAMDLISFYLFFEAVLIPLILLISGWGHAKEAAAASKKFLLFTLTGSIPMVVGLIGLALQSSAVNMESTVELQKLSAVAYQQQMTAVSSGADAIAAYTSSHQWIVWVLLLGFGIKMAILPLHSWLPTTYAVAHPNTTAFIASVVAKLGVFGIIRIVIPLTPLALAHEAQILFGALGAIAIVYGALVALAQSDLRRVLAYSSISHMGFVTVGLMTLNTDGMSGAAIQMFNHGIITCAMFLILSLLEERKVNLSFKMEDLGMASMYPRIGVLLIFFTLAGAGLPGLNGFVGELLALVGMIRVSGTITAVAVLGTVLGAWYGLKIVQRVLFGSSGTPASHHTHEVRTDCTLTEWTTLGLLAFVCLYIGVRPSGPMAIVKEDIKRLVTVTEPSSKAIRPKIDSVAQNQ
jgi:NADH-quinone oxidoreductase subunit M